MANNGGICSHCGKYCRHMVMGLCRAHYNRLRKYGDPDAGRTPQGSGLKYIQEVALAYDGDECLTWPFGKGGDGYAQVRVDGKTLGAARYICGLKHGPAPSSEHQAAHSCGRGTEGCVNPSHLSWATPVENQADRLIHGTDCRGQKSPLAKLTAEQVLSIRQMEGVLPASDVARDFGTTTQNVRLIQKRKRWAWLPDEQVAA
jgi:hypothetical protein